MAKGYLTWDHKNDADAKKISGDKFGHIPHCHQQCPQPLLSSPIVHLTCYHRHFYRISLRCFSHFAHPRAPCSPMYGTHRTLHIRSAMTMSNSCEHKHTAEELRSVVKTPLACILRLLLAPVKCFYAPSVLHVVSSLCASNKVLSLAVRII